MADLLTMLTQELEEVLVPLTRAAGNEYAREQLFGALGWDLEALTGFPIARLVEDATTITAIATALAQANPPQSLSDVQKLLGDIGNLCNAIADLAELAQDPNLNVPPDARDALATFGKSVTEFLIADYIYRSHPLAFQVGRLLTLIRMPFDGPDAMSAPIVSGTTVLRYPTAPTRVELDRLGSLISDPVGTLMTAYLGSSGLATAEDARHAAARLFGVLGMLSAVTGADVSLGMDAVVGSARDPLRTLSIRFIFPVNEVLAALGAVFELVSDAEGGAGITVTPTGWVDATWGGRWWVVTLQVSGSISGFILRRTGPVLPAGTESFSLQIAFQRRSEDGLPAAIIGAPASTRLELGSILIGGKLDLATNHQDIGLDFSLGKSAVVIQGNDGDGFLQKVLPRDGLRAEFDLALAWSQKKGLTFQGSAGLETSLPVKADLLGLVVVDSVDLALRTQGNNVIGMAASTATVRLGPITAVVEKMGLEARLSFPAEGGNLGLAHLALDFKPPSGAALSVKAAAVKGGGYLFFDPVREQYAGSLELELGGKIALKAVGLITTRLPDGSPGFSLFVLITVEKFSPIPLGMGFTLTGVGGLLGLNRTVLTEVLRQGLKRNTLDSVLFPADPVGNAPTVISNLSAVFPPAANRFLFGPIALLEWGTPTLLTLKLAVILEFPDPVRLVILGRLSVTLPDPEHPVVHIQLDAIGELNFQKGTVSLDGALFDSRLLDFTLTGSMALRASWGEQPYFLLSMGGFNPRFPVPAGVPHLERLALSLSSSEDLRLRLDGYLALTSNTAQFGARLELFARSGALSLDGYLAFDTFIQFSPFGFIANVAAGVALRYNDSLLAGIYLALTIAGPTPWHFRGTATIQLPSLSYSVEVDYRFGPAVSPPLPEPVDVGLLLRAALNDPGNWSSELPGAEHPLVTLRAVTGDGVLAHPLSRLTVRQQVVPFNFTISRFGTTRPTQERYFQVQCVIVDSALSLQPTLVEEYFALGQFQDLSEDEKLRRPSFEKMEAGFQFEADVFSYDLALGLESPIEYETTTIDPAGAPGVAQPYRPSADALQLLAVEGAAGQSAFRDTSRY